jgi:hypothetical protein
VIIVGDMIRSCPSCGAKNRIPAARASDRATCGRCKEALPPLDAPYEVESAADFDALLFRDGREAGRATGAMPAPQLMRALGLG